MLVAAAVVMVPEMFSGSGDSAQSTQATLSDDVAKQAPSQIKTYRVELQSSEPTAAKNTVEPPAERPLDEQPQANPEVATVPAVAERKPVINETPNASTPVAPEVSNRVAAAPFKPEAKPETKPADAATDGKPAGGWMVQIGSFSAQNNAQQIAAKLKTQGYPAFVSPVKVNNKTLYRVRVGGLSDRGSAEVTLQKLRGAYSGATIVAPGR